MVLATWARRRLLELSTAEQAVLRAATEAEEGGARQRDPSAALDTPAPPSSTRPGRQLPCSTAATATTWGLEAAMATATHTATSTNTTTTITTTTTTTTNRLLLPLILLWFY